MARLSVSLQDGYWVFVHWHMPLIFQARSNPAGVVISNSFDINGNSLGSSCAKVVFFI